MKYKILVTGGTGFIGRNFIKYLLKKKIFKIYSLSVFKLKKSLRYKNVNYIFCKLENASLLKKKLKHDFDYIVNLAGYIDHSNTKETLNSHFHGLKNLVNISKNNVKLKKFVQIGSSVEYGFVKSPQKEIKSLNVNNLKSIYGKSKLKSTIFLLKQYKKRKLPIIILRPYLVFGPGQDDSRLIPFVIMKCLKNEYFDCTHGKQVRNFFYIKDFLEVLFRCLNIKANGEIINVGSSRNYTVKFVINKICKITKKGKPKYGKMALRKDEPINLYPDLTKFKKIFNPKKETSLSNSLKKTIKFYYKKQDEKTLYS